MPEYSKYDPGTFCWVDLATTDASAAKEFYCQLMGWDFEDRPTDAGIPYTILQKGGKNIAGLWQMDGGMQEQGVPPHWSSYVAVESVDDVLAKVGSAGGTVLMEAADVMEEGRMAVVQDNTAATFGLWQPRNHIGADLMYEPGSVGWNELQTTDVAAASTFYASVFGWSRHEADMGEGKTYNEIKMGEQPVGGMMAIDPEWGEVPPHWDVYLCVEDCDASAAKAASLGGTVMIPPTSVSNIRFAVVQDPQGAYVGIVHVTGPGS